MNITNPSQASSSSRQETRPKGDTEGSSGTESGKKKPKKVNSELRKQQNRIASKNYREKRKRKLQYLQKLIRDDSTEPQSGLSAEAGSDPRSRSVSTEYDTQGRMLSLSPMPPPSFIPLPSNTESIIDPGLSTTTAYHSPYLTPAMPTATLEPAWSAPIYSPNPQPDVPSWNSTQWNPGFNHTPQMPIPGPGHYAYTPTRTQNFEPIPASFPSYQQSQPPISTGRVSTTHSSGYGRPTDPTQWMGSVSPQFPPTYNQWQYSGP